MGFLLIVLAGILPVSAEDWHTADGKTYKNIVVIGQEEDGVRVTYTGGVGKLPYYELSIDIQKRLQSLRDKKSAADQILAEAIRREEEQNQQQLEASTKAQAITPAPASTAPSENPPAPAATSAPQATTQPQAATPQPAAPPVNQPVAVLQQPPAAPAPATKAEEKPIYPGSKFQYDENLNVCYLDSPEVEAFPISLEAAPKALDSSHRSTLSLRITSAGRSPEAPDEIEATLFSPGGFKNLANSHKIQFLVDGVYTVVNETAGTDGDMSPAAAQNPERITFNLSPEQARFIFAGNHVNLMIGSNEYRFEQAGITLFRTYFIDVDQLPPPSFNLGRSCSKFIARIPSIVTVISTTCEYIILGGFAILVFICMAAIGLSIAKIFNW